MTDDRIHRLSLCMALSGVLLMIGFIQGSMWLRVESVVDLPVFKTSKPDLSDWPRRALLPRA